MSGMLEAQMIGVSIDRPWREIYAFAADPRNMPLWATGLGRSLERVEGEWIAQGPEGPVRVRFVERNGFGVLDHSVVLAPGIEVQVPMRVVPNGGGGEVMLTLFRQPGMTVEQFAADADWVRRDLQALKRLLEGRQDR